ncbi:MAG: site-specific integrase, partial [Actinomycetota bacterium]|nr:site-specific integrase [Actinomycetota bacterium]
LRWPVIDFDSGELRVVRALVESADGSIYEKDTKTHQVRRVALDRGTVAVLQDWRRIVEKRAADAGVEVLDDGFVFSSEVDGSRPWRPYRWTSVWRRVRQKAGIDPKVRLHDLRHFAATHLLDSGVPVKTVSARLGHARPATTLNVYAQFIPATDRAAADVMGRILAQPAASTDSVTGHAGRPAETD